MRAIAILAALAMLASLFLPWVNPAVIAMPTPAEILRGLEPDVDSLRKFVTEAPPALVAFMASFALAALFVVVALFNLPARLIAIAGGGIGVGLILYTGWQIKSGAAGIPAGNLFDFTDLNQVSEILTGMLRSGAWAWGGGSLILFLCGLLGLRRR